MRQRLRLLLAAHALVLVGGGCKPTINDIHARLPAVGSRLPAFAFTDVSGGSVSAASLQGTPTVVALWSSKCSASRLALEALGDLQAAYAPRGVRVVIIADDGDRSVVAPLLDSAHFLGTVALASGTLSRLMYQQTSVLPWHNVIPLPTFLVLDAEGRVVFRKVGVERAAAGRLQIVRDQVDSVLAHPRPVARTQLSPTPGMT